MKKTVITACVVAVACTLQVSCTKDFVKINTNPNKIEFPNATPQSLFEPLIYGIGVSNQNHAWFYANELVQVTAFTGGATTQIHQYQITDGQWQSIWDNYARYGFDAHHLIDRAIEREDKYMEGIGLILKVYELSTLSALYGDIPYREAYKQNENTAPAFESQQQLAADFIADLDSAATILKRRPSVQKPGLDKMYLDNHAKWVKFANSLKLRILCRMSGISDSYWAQIQAIVDNPADYPVFTDNSDNAIIPYQDMYPYRSYWGQQNMVESTFTSHRITETMVNMMVEFNAAGNAIFEDPRTLIYATQRGNVWKGSRGGITMDEYKQYDNNAATPNFAVLSRAAAPAFLMEYSEVLFILAEGVQKGKLIVPGYTAKDLYEMAVRASIDKWAEYGQFSKKPVTVRKADVNYLLETSKLGSYAKAAAEDGTSMYSSAEELIACQKFISLYFNGMEVFNEWRRTEYPNFEIANGTVANGYEVPTRLGYPNYTVASNSAHVQEALERMGGESAVNNMHVALDWSYKKIVGSHRNPHPLQ